MLRLRAEPLLGSAAQVWCGGGGVDEMDSAMEAHELHALQSIAAQPCADAGAAAAAGFRPCGDASFMDVQYDLDTMMALVRDPHPGVHRPHW